MNPREALLRVREVVGALGDGRVRHSYYLAFHRRLQVLRPGGVLVLTTPKIALLFRRRLSPMPPL